MKKISKILTVSFLALGILIGCKAAVYAGSVDLSTSTSFPPIKDGAADSESSIAFATAYYQYTFAVNHKKGIAANSTGTYYSPAWINSYADNLGDAYKRLKQKGCLKWSEMPYTAGVKQLSQNETAMINALNTRVDKNYTLSIETANNPIKSNADIQLELIKALLKDNKVLVVQMRGTGDFGNCMIGKTQNGQNIIYRNAEENGLYTMAVVGYDDEIAIDVNRDGKIDKTEKGALKLAAAKGTAWGNAGYIWVLYDALNKNSQITGGWESDIESRRIAAFDTAGTGTNTFHYIFVADKEISLIAKMSFTMQGNGSVNISWGEEASYGENIRNGGSYLLINDASVKNLEEMNYMRAKIDVYKTQNITISNVKCELFDDERNILVGNDKVKEIKGNEYITYGIVQEPAKFLLGDMDLDGRVTTQDAQKVLRISLKIETCSNFKKLLADFDKDGKSDTKDAQLALKRALKIS